MDPIWKDSQAGVFDVEGSALTFSCRISLCGIPAKAQKEPGVRGAEGRVHDGSS